MAIKENETAAWVDFLNEVAKLDPEFLGRLVGLRVRCNENLINHPTIQCGLAEEYQNAAIDNQRLGGDLAAKQPVCGFLGLLNGFLGAYETGPKAGWGPVTVVIEKDGRVTAVRRTQ